MKDKSVWPPVVPEEKEPTAVQPKHSAPVASLCQRCRQPLDGDQEYICCADKTLTWSCAHCHKVSEGFALPFGLCPACGGAFETGYSGPATNDYLVEAVRQAMEIELGGISFYQRGMQVVADAELAELFARMVAMEREHAKTLARRYHVPLPDLPSPGITETSVAVYSGAESPPRDAVTLLQLAIHLENRARTFFLDQGRRFATGSHEWRLYRELEAEEREHADVLRTTLVRLKANKPLLT